MIIEELGPVGEATMAVCEGIEPVTTPVGDGVEDIPVFGAVLGDVVDGVTNEDTGVLCNLRMNLGEFVDALDESLSDLTGPGGLLGTGMITSTQTITTEGTTTTAQATATVSDLSILGVSPLGEVDALATTSAATLDTSTAEATVDTTAVEVDALPLLGLTTDLETITGDLTGIPLDGLTELLAQIQNVLDGLAGIGIEAANLDAAGAVLEDCPEALDGQLSGTFEQPGTCAAAAARGYGLAVTVPAELATPLVGLAGPLQSLQFAPTSAVVRGRRPAPQADRTRRLRVAAPPPQGPRS